MTREEAKAYIIQHCIPNYPKMDKTEWDAAMGKAIEALRQPEQPSFSCGQENDTISRAAAISEIKQMCREHKWDNFHGGLIHWTGIVAMLEQLPSAQSRSGTWQDRYGMFACSECGREYIQRHHYCPHCGTKMLRENEG